MRYVDTLNLQEITAVTFNSVGEIGMELTWEYDLLGTIDLLDPNEKGIYVIWNPGAENFRYRALYVGQGDPIRRRLRAHNDDYRILVYRAS